MLDLTKSCMKYSHLQRTDRMELKCGITNIPVRFEYSCELFEKNTEIEELENEACSNLKFNYAGNYKRISNYFIDVLAVVILTNVLEFITGKYHVMNSELFVFLFKDQIGSRIFILFLFFLYYTIFESLTGKTLGKYLTKTKVVNPDGKKPVWTRVLLRSLCRLIPLDQISFLFDFKSGWHDTLSKTIVIEEKQVVV